jgi:starch synthase
MKVLYAASEVAPIIKLGGLGDVAGSLPKALEKLGIDVDVIVPYFPIAKTPEKTYKALEINVPYGGENYTVEIHKTKLPNSNVDVFLLRNARFFTLGGKEAFANSISETEMFMFFDKAVVEFVKAEFNTYDIVHCNDWHTGLVTHLLSDEIPDSRPKTLFTIHNLMYQGIGDKDTLRDVGIVPGTHRLIDWDIADGDVNMMLQGVTSSDYINAVSPTYAEEILTERFGGGLAEILKAREGRLSGIINGIDPSQFARNYDVSDWKDVKGKAKQDLRKKLGLKTPEGLGDIPIFAFISRLDANQKGLDILFDAISEFVKKGSQFVLLGTGDPMWEGKLREYGEKNVGDVSMNILFDAKMAEEIYSASDFLIVPSKYEPCGLIQMIAMWYGTLPVAHAVGGLKDSIQSGVNGFTFDEYSTVSLLGAVDKALKIYGTKDFDLMVSNAMRTDFSWDRSAQEYKKLYEKMLATV